MNVFTPFQFISNKDNKFSHTPSYADLQEQVAHYHQQLEQANETKMKLIKGFTFFIVT